MKIFYFKEHIFDPEQLVTDLEDKFDCVVHSKANKQLPTDKNLTKVSVKYILRRNLKIFDYPIDSKYLIIRIARNNGFIINKNNLQDRLVFEYNPIQIKCEYYL